MRVSLLTVGLLACMLTLVVAWSKEDHEIFRLKDEVELSEGVGVSFYDFLDVKPSATQDDINKAYRKKSRTLHPDKAKKQFVAEKTTGKDRKKGSNASKGPSKAEIKAATKAASDRFARLGIVTEILRGSGRARYDHFLSNGFPTWKGTGYYYERFRPGFFSVLAGLFIFVGGAGHWLILYTSWQRDQAFVKRLIAHAHKELRVNLPGIDETATPVPAAEEPQQQIPKNRRERRMADKMESKDAKNPKKSKDAKAAKATATPTPPSGSSVPKRKVQAPNGRLMAVDAAGNVYMEQRDEEGEVHEFLLNPSEFPAPTYKSTALYRLPIWVFTTAVSRFNPSSTSSTEENEDVSSDEIEQGSETSNEDSSFEVIKKERAETSAVNGTGKAVKRGGKKGRK